MIETNFSILLEFCNIAYEVSTAVRVLNSASSKWRGHKRREKVLERGHLCYDAEEKEAHQAKRYLL